MWLKFIVDSEERADRLARLATAAEGLAMEAEDLAAAADDLTDLDAFIAGAPEAPEASAQQDPLQRTLFKQNLQKTL